MKHFNCQFISVLLLVFSCVCGCVKSDVVEYRSENIELHFSGNFNGEAVSCYVDDKLIFDKKKLISSPTTGLADRQYVTVAQPRFKLKVVVNGYASIFEVNTRNGKYISFHQLGNAIGLIQERTEPQYR